MSSSASRLGGTLQGGETILAQVRETLMQRGRDLCGSGAHPRALRSAAIADLSRTQLAALRSSHGTLSEVLVEEAGE